MNVGSSWLFLQQVFSALVQPGNGLHTHTHSHTYSEKNSSVESKQFVENVKPHLFLEGERMV